MAKDVRITADMARAIDAFAPIAEQCSALWSEAAEQFGGEHDQFDVVRLWVEKTDVTLTASSDEP